MATVDTVPLETKLKEMYRHVAQEPGGGYHFELGERLALRVGYDAIGYGTCRPGRSSPSRVSASSSTSPP